MEISMMSRGRRSISATPSEPPTPMRLRASVPPTPNRLDVTSRRLEWVPACRARRRSTLPPAVKAEVTPARYDQCEHGRNNLESGRAHCRVMRAQIRPFRCPLLYMSHTRLRAAWKHWRAAPNLLHGIGCTITIHWTPNLSVTPPKHCAKNVFPIGIVTLPSAASALKMRSRLRFGRQIEGEGHAVEVRRAGPHAIRHEELGTGDPHARVHDALIELWRHLVGARLFGIVLEAHLHEDFGIQLGLVVFDGLLAATAEK